jgi:hypothetical protein
MSLLTTTAAFASKGDHETQLPDNAPVITKTQAMIDAEKAQDQLSFFERLQERHNK